MKIEIYVLFFIFVVKNSLSVRKSPVVRGIMYEIHSASSDRFMWLPVWESNGDSDVRVLTKPLDMKDQIAEGLAKWYLSPTDEADVYEIRSASNNTNGKDRFMWLPIWENNGDSDVRVLTKPLNMKDRIEESLAKWYLSPTDEADVYEIRSDSNDRNAKDRFMWLPVWENNKDNDVRVITKPLSMKNQIDANLAKWYFVPINYKLQALVTNFQFEDDVVKKVLAAATKHDLIDKHSLVVDAGSIGAYVSRTFKKSVTNTFTWGLTETLGVEVSVAFQVGVPGLASETSSFKTSFSVSSNQEWSESKTTEISVTASAVAKEPGKYEMSGWVDIAENVELPFKAEAIYSGTQILNGVETDLTAEQVVSLIKYSGASVTVSKYDGNKVHASVSGIMKATYGLNSYTNVFHTPF